MSEPYQAHKPLKGATVTANGKVVGIVERDDDGICWITQPDGTSDCFIWRFRNGLNTLHDWPTKTNPRTQNAEGRYLMPAQI
jgi:hypothetical protein